MSATIEIPTTLTGLTLTLSAFPDGSDTAAVSEASLTEASNRPGVYSFSNSTETGLHMLILYEDSDPVWMCWAVLTTDGKVIASETREEALLQQSLTQEGIDKTGYSLTEDYDLAKTAAQAGDQMNLVDGALSLAKTGSDLRVKLHATQEDYAPAKPGASMTLTSGERSAIAAAVEAAIIDDTDSNAVLEAIVNKIAEVNPDLGDLTVQSIAAAARDATLNAILANFDSEGSIGEAIASILAKVAPLPADPASETIATSNKNAITSAISGLHNVSTAQVQSAAAAAIAAYDPPTRSELTSDKNEIMGAIPSASSTASAVRSELNTELQRIDATISSRLAPSTEGRTLNVGEDGSVVTEFDPQALQEALQEVFESGDLSLTVASFSPAAIAQLAARKQLVVLHCGVVVSGKMRLIQGDAYRDDLGNALDFSREDFPDLDGAETVHFSAQLLPTAQHSETIQLTGSIVETTGVKVLRFEVSSEQSIEWTPGNYEARVLVTFPNGNTRTFLTFTLEVLGKIG